MMSLGDFVFGISTAAYVELERQNSWRWPALDRIGAKPRTQSIGPGQETLRLSGTIYPHFVAQQRGLDQLPLMRDEADRSSETGEPLLLVDGTGLIWGEFVITNLREGQNTFFSDGTPRAITFDIDLAGYG